MFYEYLVYVHEEGIDNPVITQRHYIVQGHHLPRDIRQSEIEKLFTAIGDQLRDRTIFPLMVHTGMRVGEVVNLRLADVYISENRCGVPVAAQRLRHAFASQMLTVGMPVSSLQHDLGHEHLDTTLIYAEVSDPLLRQDYYQGIATLDPGSEKLSMSGLELNQQYTLRQLVEELKTPGME